MRQLGVSAFCSSWCYSASSLIRSLRSVIRLRRALPAHSKGMMLSYQQKRGITGRAGCGEKRGKATALPFFHRLRPPDELHKNHSILGAQISRRRNPTQLSRYSAFPSLRLPRALLCSYHTAIGVYPLLKAAYSHTTPDTQFRLGSSLQAGLYARTPRSVRLSEF